MGACVGILDENHRVDRILRRFAASPHFSNLHQIRESPFPKVTVGRVAPILIEDQSRTINIDTKDLRSQYKYNVLTAPVNGKACVYFKVVAHELVKRTISTGFAGGGEGGRRRTHGPATAFRNGNVEWVWEYRYTYSQAVDFLLVDTSIQEDAMDIEDEKQPSKFIPKPQAATKSKAGPAEGRPKSEESHSVTVYTINRDRKVYAMTATTLNPQETFTACASSSSSSSSSSFSSSSSSPPSAENVPDTAPGTPLETLSEQQHDPAEYANAMSPRSYIKTRSSANRTRKTAEEVHTVSSDSLLQSVLYVPFEQARRRIHAEVDSITRAFQPHEPRPRSMKKMMAQFPHHSAAMSEAESGAEPERAGAVCGNGSQWRYTESSFDVGEEIVLLGIVHSVPVVHLAENPSNNNPESVCGHTQAANRNAARGEDRAGDGAREQKVHRKEAGRQEAASPSMMRLRVLYPASGDSVPGNYFQTRTRSHGSWLARADCWHKRQPQQQQPPWGGVLGEWDRLMFKQLLRREACIVATDLPRFLNLNSRPRKTPLSGTPFSGPGPGPGHPLLMGNVPEHDRALSSSSGTDRPTSHSSSSHAVKQQQEQHKQQKTVSRTPLLSIAEIKHISASLHLLCPRPVDISARPLPSLANLSHPSSPSFILHPAHPAPSRSWHWSVHTGAVSEHRRAGAERDESPDEFMHIASQLTLGTEIQQQQQDDDNDNDKRKEEKKIEVSGGRESRRGQERGGEGARMTEASREKIDDGPEQRKQLGD